MTKFDAGFEWPQVGKGRDAKDAPVAYNETLGIFMCKSCWNADHARSGSCPIEECQCGCYHGKVKGLNGPPRKPAKDCTEQQSLPDVGAEWIGPKSDHMKDQMAALEKGTLPP